MPAFTIGNPAESKRLRTIYPTERHAREAATAAHRQMQRATARLDITLAHARLDLIAETQVRITGWKPQFDQRIWLDTEVTHTLWGGLSTQAKLEPLNQNH